MCFWCDPQFWVSVASAVGTLAAVVVALFLRELRAVFRAPKLDLMLARPGGVPAKSFIPPAPPGQPGEGRFEKSRYYHLRVSNPRRKADAVHDVVVTLLRVERKQQDGAYHETWSGSIRTAWRNEEPGSAKRVVGTWSEADLCSVLKDQWLQLHLTQTPYNLDVVYLKSGVLPVDLILTLQARGNEVDSEVKRWRVYWNGNWEDGEQEMRRHFFVAPVS